MNAMGRLWLFFLLFWTNNIVAEHKIVSRIFKILDPIEDRSTFEQNKPLLKLILCNKNILFKELTQNNTPPYPIAQIFLKLAVFTSKNFDAIAPRDRFFTFHKDQLKLCWKFIIKKIKLLLESDQPISFDVRFIKITASQDISEDDD